MTKTSDPQIPEGGSSLSNTSFGIGQMADGTITVLTVEEARALQAKWRAEEKDEDEPSDDISDLGDVVEAFDPAGSKKKTDAQDDWNESDHPRGQPENAGEFSSSGVGSGSKKSKSAKSSPKNVADHPDFKKWFGSSKITDEDGKPRLVYKAMMGETPHMVDGVTHVALRRDGAQLFSQKDKPVREVYVKSDKPFDFRNEADRDWLIKQMEKPKNVSLFNKQTKEIMGPDYDHVATKREIAGGIEDGAYQIFEVPIAKDLIKSKGYDSIYIVEEGESSLEPNLAVFDPGQIRTVESFRSKPDIHSNLTTEFADSTQPVKSIDELYERAKAEEPAFREQVAKIAAATGSKVKFSEKDGSILKTRESSERKLRDELGGDASKLRDVLRGTVISDSVEKTRQTVADFIEDHGDDILRIKDRIVGPTSSGYRDILVNFRTPGGLVAELQFNSKAMLAAKDKGHEFYDEIRTGKAKGSFDELQAKSRALYDAAYKADGNGNWSQASA